MNWTDEERAEVTDLGATEYGALVRDARRYRWLRRDDIADRESIVMFTTSSGEFYLHDLCDLDAHIDAAMEAAK